MLKASRLLPAAVLCFASLTAYAQEPKPKPTQELPQKPSAEMDDVVRITTELVQTDVMVFDKDGRFVPGLQKEQFELLVDGKPQPISFFESVVMGGRREAAVLRSARGGKGAPPPPPAENAGGEDVSERGRTILFFINDLHLDPSSLARTHKVLNNFIDNQLGPNDQAAITSSSGQIGFLQQLTNNRAVLRAATARLNAVPGQSRDNDRPYMSDYAAYLMMERNDKTLFDWYVEETKKAMHLDNAAMLSSIVENRAKKILIWSDVAVKNALSSLVNLMNATQKLPGRKIVFFISDGFIPNFTGSDFTTMMRRATDSAANGGVVIYSLDARGLIADAVADASSGGGFDPTGILSNRMSGERSFKQEALHALAADTGGRALLNSNALDQGIQRALDETSRYYLLAWRPENRGPKTPKMKITIAGRPELKVQLRRGFLGAPTEKKAVVQPTNIKVENNELLGVSEASDEDITTSLSLGYKQTQGENLQLNSSMQLSAPGASDGGTAPIVTIVIGAVFDSKGKGVGSFKQRVEVPRTRPNSAPVYTYVNHQVDLPPGLYQVRTIAYERGTTRLTHAMDWLELPKIKPGTFATSSLYVGEIVDGGGGSQVGVNAGHRFARSSRLRFTTYIYNAQTKGTPQLGVKIRVMRGAQDVITPAEIKVSTEKASNLANIPYTGEFPLQSLPPGNYVLDLTVNDQAAGKSASQQYPFTVY
jgi:VWFA-related protein